MLRCIFFDINAVFAYHFWSLTLKSLFTHTHTHTYTHTYHSPLRMRAHRHAVVLGITFTGAVFLMLIVLTVTGYVFIHKTDTSNKGLPAMSPWALGIYLFLSCININRNTVSPRGIGITWTPKTDFLDFPMSFDGVYTHFKSWTISCILWFYLIILLLKIVSIVYFYCLEYWFMFPMIKLIEYDPLSHSTDIHHPFLSQVWWDL